MTERRKRADSTTAAEVAAPQSAWTESDGPVVWWQRGTVVYVGTPHGVDWPCLVGAQWSRIPVLAP